MKWTLLILSTVFLFACNNDNTDDGKLSTEMVNNPVTPDNKEAGKDQLPKFKFNNLQHDFGIIVQGEKVAYTYIFENTGKSDLLISRVTASCGCTVPSYEKKPVKPGDKGEIEIVFDSRGRKGKQYKTARVIANTQPNTVKLSFTAEIIVPENK